MQATVTSARMNVSALSNMYREKIFSFFTKRSLRKPDWCAEVSEV